ncbi:TatD family hydrolase [Legionella londiniensis]|uniref:Deoxyribonuclease belonging to the TatD DNAse family protein n=1 Tax=Legionella londiniensis TaxID=45068 RepID=A0A0W0VKN9_9GAMM|nr:TatD family hydrolase [Legionella londiniensis]KTD20627.1 deoxyribonuclease belonging to the TatD DNAse family protein [Legionella londiniensis]STX92902.1 deoxyribonuclease belonging to the TatD DNAse family [Legionella londiniensis]
MQQANQTAALIDSHCHLHSLELADFNHDMDEVIKKAHDNGVQGFLCVCIELDELPMLHQLANRYSNLYISAGIHPNIESQEEPSAEKLAALASHPACIAIGETGLDYYRTEGESAKELQRLRFRNHIRASIISKKPLIIHTRTASDDTLRLMKEENASIIGGVMHCFAEDWEFAKRALDLGFYISFSGIVTFRNAEKLQEVAKKVPIDRILVETDAPYLAPVPYRGKQNHPALVKYVAQKLSELRATSYDRLAEMTTENFFRCFRLK